MKLPYAQLLDDLATSQVAPWAQQLALQAEEFFHTSRHGDLPRWLAALEALQPSPPGVALEQTPVRLGTAVSDPGQFEPVLREFHPWRKGPISIGGLVIDTEWRSDWKWDRLAPYVDLQQHTVLDVGCGNGYFGWRMLGAGARTVVGIDPTVLFVMQYLVCRHFAGTLPNYVLPLGIEDLPADLNGFDSVFSMGVLYHRRSPITHLEQLRQLLRTGGQLILETLVVAGDERTVLVPEGRYAKMRNVWFLPSTDLLQRWLQRCGFVDIRLLDVSVTSLQEQRRTAWMQFESLADFLQPGDSEYTIEGHPAPCRALLLARKPG